MIVENRVSRIENQVSSSEGGESNCSRDVFNCQENLVFSSSAIHVIVRRLQPPAKFVLLHESL